MDYRIWFGIGLGVAAVLIYALVKIDYWLDARELAEVNKLYMENQKNKE